MSNEKSIESTFAIPQTSCHMKSYGTNELSGIVFHGYTFDSHVWTAIKNRLESTPKGQKIVIGKNETYMPVVTDKNEDLRQREAMIELITNITGAPEPFDREIARARMLNPEQWKYMLDQWIAHLDDRANFLNAQKLAQQNGLAA